MGAAPVGGYRSGRIIAALFRLVGAIGLCVSLLLAGWALLSMQPGGVQTLFWSAVMLQAWLLGEIGRAVFDIAQRRAVPGHQGS